MNDYFYSKIVEEKNEKLEMANRHAWKYSSLNKCRSVQPFGRLVSYLFKTKQPYASCCSC